LVEGEMAKTTASRKAKGRNLQNKVREMLLEAFPLLQDGDVKTALMGETGSDIKFSPCAKQQIPYIIECKNQERINIWEYIGQAEDNAKKEMGVPLVVFKRNRSKIYAIIEFSELLRVLSNGRR